MGGLGSVPGTDGKVRFTDTFYYIGLLHPMSRKAQISIRLEKRKVQRDHLSLASSLLLSVSCIHSLLEHVDTSWARIG